MKLSLFPLATFSLFAASLAACGPGKPAPNQEPPAAEDQAAPAAAEEAIAVAAEEPAPAAAEEVAEPELEGVRLRATNFPELIIRNIDALGELQAATTVEERRSGTFRIVDGLAGRGISFQSAADPSLYLRHEGFRLKFAPNDETEIFRNDASFEQRDALSGAANAYSYESVNFPGYFIRHCGQRMWIDNNDNCKSDLDVFHHDASFTVEATR